MSNKQLETSIKLAQQRDACNLCVVCERSQEQPRKRGLCTTCYSRWRSKRFGKSPAQQADFDAACIAAGALMPDRSGQDLTQTENVFDRIARQVTGDDVESYIAEKRQNQARRRKS